MRAIFLCHISGRISQGLNYCSWKNPIFYVASKNGENREQKSARWQYFRRPPITIHIYISAAADHFYLEMSFMRGL